MNLTQIRHDTPGVSSCNHLMAAGSSLMPQSVSEAVIEYTRLESRIGGYEAASTIDHDTLYSAIATLIGASADEIAVLENATAAWCHAFYALPLTRGQRILTCEAEYAANYVAFLHRARRDGLIIDVIPSDDKGSLDINALESMIDDTVGVIAITWVPTNGGLVNPAAAVGRLAKRHGIPFLLDACQAVGQMPVDVDQLGCDFLSATGRKFLRGPRGTGFLYVRKAQLQRLEPAMIDHFAAPWVSASEYQLRSDARRFENWENAYALRVGLEAAVHYALAQDMNAIRDRVRMLADRFRQQVLLIAGARVLDRGAEQCAIVSFSIDGLQPRDTVAALREQHIYIGASDPASTRLDSESRQLPTLLRMSPHYYNTVEEVDALLDALSTLKQTP